MMESSSSSAHSQSKQGKHKWTIEEDAALVSAMIDLRNLGTYNADTGFKSGYLPKLEKLLWKYLSNCGLRGKPHIESRLKTLEKEWSVVYDMTLQSGFGWDATRKMATAEEFVWKDYVMVHKEARQFRTKSFPYFDELSMIYAKDRATGRDAQAAEDIIREIKNENVADEIEVEGGTTAPEDFYHAFSQNRVESRSTSSVRKRKKSQVDLSSISETISILAADMKEACSTLSKNIHSDILQEKFLELPGALRSVAGLSSTEVRRAIQKFGNHSNHVLLFFGTDPEDRLEMVRDFLEND